MYWQSKDMALLLLFISVMLVITYLQQEFVLLPALQKYDIVGENAKSIFIEKWYRWRWISFFITPVLLLIRLFLVSCCLYIGSFFFVIMAGNNFSFWFSVALRSQSVLIVYSVILYVINSIVGFDGMLEISKYTSLLFLAGDEIEQWVKLPLASVCVVELLYWLFMARQVSTQTASPFSISFKFVMSSYGIGYLFFIILQMFLMLYLN